MKKHTHQRVQKLTLDGFQSGKQTPIYGCLSDVDIEKIGSEFEEKRLRIKGKIDSIMQSVDGWPIQDVYIIASTMLSLLICGERGIEKAVRFSNDLFRMFCEVLKDCENGKHD